MVLRLLHGPQSLGNLEGEINCCTHLVMKMVIFLVSRLKRFDGQTKAVLNFTSGLLRLNMDVTIVGYYIREDIKREVTQKLGINIYNISSNDETLFGLANEYYFDGISKKLMKIVHSLPKDIILVSNDIIVNTIKYNKKKYPMIYWSQGAIASLFMWPLTYSKSPTLRKLVSMTAPVINLRFSNSVKRYPCVLANSKTTGNIISLFYDTPPTDVVYPPIHVEYYARKAKTETNEDDKYVLVFLKRGYPASVNVIKKLAENVRIKVVGYQIDNAKSFINISDEELIDLYCNAYVTIYPITFENFGYIPVESMACGTPVVAYRFSGGPSETIIHERTGWLVNTEKDLYKKALEIYKNGYDMKMRKDAIERAKDFSYVNSTEKLLYYIKNSSL
ncbi:glycosyltransferase [Metallosphaera sp.]